MQAAQHLAQPLRLAQQRAVAFHRGQRASRASPTLRAHLARLFELTSASRWLASSWASSQSATPANKRARAVRAACINQIKPRHARQLPPRQANMAGNGRPQSGAAPAVVGRHWAKAMVRPTD